MDGDECIPGMNFSEQKKKSPVPTEYQRKSSQGANRVVLLDQSLEPNDFKNITIPLILQNCYVIAIVDTGSTFSLIQKSLWKKLSGHEDYQPSGGQTFLLANGQRQSSVGKVNWDCEVQGQMKNVTFCVMQDSNLTVPIMVRLGIEFLLKSKMVLDFNQAQFQLSSTSPEPKIFPFMQYNCHSSTYFYLAMPTGSLEDQQQIL